MKKTRRRYTREFKLEALRLLETSGKGAAQIERDLGIGAGCLSRWKREFATDGEQAFPGQGRLTPDYLPYLAIWVLLGLIILGIALKPLAGFIDGGLLLLGIGIIVALYLSQKPTDVIVVGVCLPIIAGAFGFGILKWQFMQLVRLFTVEP
jgi:hypothetical protein